MFSLAKKKDQRGFTIVELLIVIVVIGILAALVVTTYGGIQAKARDSERQSDLQALQTQIEAYYADKGSYPSLAQMNSATWRKDNLKGLDAGALKDPKGANSTLSATEIADSATTGPSDNQYAYTVSGSACTGETATNCDDYTLSTFLEGSKKAYKKTALE